jgi:hypothetical protein
MRYLYKAGELVGHGCYFGLKNGDELIVTRGTRILPDTTTFLRMPWLAVLLLAPVLGALFVILMPFIGIALTFYVVAEAAATNLGAAVHRMGAARRAAHDLR